MFKYHKTVSKSITSNQNITKNHTITTDKPLTVLKINIKYSLA